MNAHAKKKRGNKPSGRSQERRSASSQKETSGTQFSDNRLDAVTQRKLQEIVNTGTQSNQLTQLQMMAKTIAPSPIQKEGMEEEELLQGKFEKLHKTEGSFNEASGQEKHLPLQDSQVVQKKQGRGAETQQMKGNLSDDAGLENEAATAGTKTQNPDAVSNKIPSTQQTSNGVMQLVVFQNEAALWQAVAPDSTLINIRKIIDGNSELKEAFEDSLLNLNRMNFVESAGTQPVASYKMNQDTTYDITYGLRETQNGNFKDEEKFIGAIIHEMGHVNSGLQYQTNVPEGEVYHIVNMHLPVAKAPFFDDSQVGENQRTDVLAGWEAQRQTMKTNWDQIENLRSNNHGFTREESAYLKGREDYAKGVAPEAHYDTVLVDILYYLQYHGLTETHYYLQATAMLQEANVRRRAGAGTVQLVGLVQQPDNDFLTLYNDVSGLLNNPLWAREGKAFIGRKTPSGVNQMIGALDNANKRISLNNIQQIASAKMGQASKYRSESTSELYEILSKVNRRANFGELITDIALCEFWLGRDWNESVELN